MKTRDGIVSAIIILLIIILIVVSSILIVNGKKDKASDDISDQMKAYYNDAPRPKGRGIGAFGSSSGLDSGSSAEI